MWKKQNRPPRNKTHKSSDAALKTLSAFRKTIGSIITPPTTGTSEPPKKKQRVQKFSADYDDGGGAGPSNASPTSSRNKSVADNTSPNVNPLVAPKKKKKKKKLCTNTLKCYWQSNSYHRTGTTEGTSSKRTFKEVWDRTVSYHNSPTNDVANPVNRNFSRPISGG